MTAFPGPTSSRCNKVPANQPLHHDAAAERRRIFLTAGIETFQLFSVSQNSNDGSVYFSAPLFEEINWLVPAMGAQQEPILLAYKSDGPGKLSLHGSGVTHVSPHQATTHHGFAVRGNQLKAADGSSLGVRHLLTILPPEPTHRPTSAAMARKTDYVLTSKEFHPYVLIFWAVPAMRPLTVTINGSFQADELQEIPPNGGWGAFNLLLHSVVWFAYRTKHMERWPRNAQACYHDGLTVPVLIGTGLGAFRMELRQPMISLQEGNLTISI